MNLYQVAEEIGRRLANIFLQGQGRPAAGLRRHARSSRTTRTGAICILFYEYFHGDNGAGLGASHQTGWTGVIARIMHLFATMNARAGARRRQDGLLPERAITAAGTSGAERVLSRPRQHPQPGDSS